MPWAKFSDTAAHHPAVLAPMAFDPAAWQPPRWTQADVVNLLLGVFTRCAVQSAGYLTDYVITPGVLASTAGDNWRHWATLMERAGYLTPAELDDGGPAWRLVDDPTNLVHIRLKDELEWERQRKRDNGNPALTVAVRLRDGDACRYCGVIVVWGDQRGGRGGTYDHRIAGQAAASPDDLRVACHACNARRSNKADADDWCPPRPAPAAPHYGPKTAAMLREHGHRVRRSRTPRPGTRPDPATSTTRRPRTQRDTATDTPTGDPATSRTPHRTTGTAPAPSPSAPAATPHPAEPRDTDTTSTTPSTITPPGARDPAPSGTPPDQPQHQDQKRLVDPANRRSPEPGSPGRVGTGREPTSLYPSPDIRPRPPRGRRGRRRQQPT
ncbi:hypothetical protein [Actinoplanes sp. NPDC026623]|uniref:hypothetical protein n=1 Tax=Actinoplanes sp. NPDC026623 TaxID=3155610 RepID=UPI0033F97AEB